MWNQAVLQKVAMKISLGKIHHTVKENIRLSGQLNQKWELTCIIDSECEEKRKLHPCICMYTLYIYISLPKLE